jgi:hypothetical protein
MSAWPSASSATAVSAVSRVASVGRADGPALPSRIRDTDPSGAGFPRPEPSRLPPQDVARFEDLVFGPQGRPAPFGPGGAGPVRVAPPPAVGAMLADAPPVPPAPAPLNVADRIAHTLGHLSVVRGL